MGMNESFGGAVMHYTFFGGLCAVRRMHTRVETRDSREVFAGKIQDIAARVRNIYYACGSIGQWWRFCIAPNV